MNEWKVDRYQWDNNHSGVGELQNFLNDLEDRGWNVEGVEFFEFFVVVISTRKEPTEPVETESKWKRNPDWKPIGGHSGGRINRIS